MRRTLAIIAIALCAQTASAAELVRLVRFKISAGDLASGIHAAEEYKRTTGVDGEYLDAIGWIARGAELLRKPDLAKHYVAELRREIPNETEALLVPYGAAIEVQGRLIAASEGRGAAIRYFENELARAQATSLRSRIRKNINLLSLEGQQAPAIESATLEKGKPAVLYFWMDGCGDCKSQAPTITRVFEKYRDRVTFLAPTRLYGGSPTKPVTPDEERANIAKGWKETYPGLDAVPVIISADTMVRYGASATPTFAIVDKKGIIRLYTPTRVSETELSRKIDEVLAE